MAYDKLPDYLIYRNIIRGLLRAVGLWPNKNPSLFYRLLPFPFLIVNLNVILGTFFYVKMNFTNIAAAMKGLSMLTSFITIVLKMACVMINRKDYDELHGVLDHYFRKLLDNQEISTVIMSDFRIFRRLSWVFTTFASIIIFLLASTPIISLISQHVNAANPIHYPLVYPTQYPWSFNPPSFRYKIHFLIEYAAIVPHLCVSPSIDSLFMMYSWQIIGQFREMSYRITHIDEKANDRNVVQGCVLQHQLMLRCRDILQKIFGPILLWVMTTNAIALCSFIFQLTQMKSMNIATLITFAVYILFKVLQTFMYAYAGTCLTSESENYQRAIYNAEWYANKRFMSSVVIMLSQKPMILTACNFSVVSLNIFVKVLNTTVSYFFLLQTVS